MTNMDKFTFIEWINIINSPMVIDHDLTELGVNSKLPDKTTMILYYRKRGVLLATKINKNKLGITK